MSDTTPSTTATGREPGRGAAGTRLTLLAEGDAETRDCWSGLAQKFVQALRELDVRVDTRDVELKGARKAFAAAVGFRLDREAWRNRYILGPTPFRLRTGKARRHLRTGRRDAVLQIGATFRCPPAALGETPLVLYCDANAMFAAGGRPWSSVSALPDSFFEQIVERERTVYQQADRIWCTSDCLARSFREDFGIEEARLRTIYAGANVVPAKALPGRPTSTPNALFVGKEFRRKGWDTLAAAWPRVREAVDGAELHVVGGRPAGAADLPGVRVHGFIPSDEPEGRAKLQSLYEHATVFCLPSHYEPFGVVFAEAMLAGLPCIGTDQWAMPEIITPETGWLVPDADVDELAKALIAALGDPERASSMGEAATRRAEDLFTWRRVAERARDDLEDLLDRGGARQAG